MSLQNLIDGRQLVLRLDPASGAENRGSKLSTIDHQGAQISKTIGELKRVVAPYTGVIKRLSSPFVTWELSKRVIDTTGPSMKISMWAKINAHLKSTSERIEYSGQREFDRPIYLSAIVPGAATVRVHSHAGSCYPNPAIEEAAFRQEGGWHERSGALKVYNTFAAANGAHYTAAALQMALYYLNGHVLPAFGIEAPPVMFPAHPGHDSRETPGPQYTCFMPSNLAQQHSPAALSVVYHALEAKGVLALAGERDFRDCVYNVCGPLPREAFSIDAFWEAFHILRLSSCGSAGGDRWDTDFLMGMIHNFGVHGITDEGGIYRKFFGSIPIQKNQGIIVSDYNRATTGFVVLRPSEIINASIGFQTIISRALYESLTRMEDATVAPMASNADAWAAMSNFIVETRQMMGLATGLDPIIFDSYIQNATFQTDDFRDRHLSSTHANVLRTYSTFMPTMAYPIGDTAFSKHSSPKDGHTIVTFTGKGTTVIREFDGRAFVELPIDDKITPANGLYWLMPGINRNDGVADITYAFSEISHLASAINSLPLVDGPVIETGEAIAEYVWTDNGDLVPSEGSLRSTLKGLHYGETHFVDPLLRDYEYTIHVSKYAPVPVQRNEQANGRIRCHQNANYRVTLPSMPRKLVNVADFYRTVKRWRKNRIDRQLAMIESKLKRDKERLAETFGVPPEGKFASDAAVEQVKSMLTHSRYTDRLSHLIQDLLASDTTASGIGLLTDSSRILAWAKGLSSLREYDFHFLSTDELKRAEEQIEKEASARTSSSTAVKPKVRIAYGSSKTPRELLPGVYRQELSALSDLARAIQLHEGEDYATMLFTLIDDAAYKDFISTMTEHVQTTYANKRAELLPKNYASATTESTEVAEDDQRRTTSYLWTQLSKHSVQVTSQQAQYDTAYPKLPTSKNVAKARPGTDQGPVVKATVPTRDRTISAEFTSPTAEPSTGSMTTESMVAQIDSLTSSISQSLITKDLRQQAPMPDSGDPITREATPSTSLTEQTQLLAEVAGAQGTKTATLKDKQPTHEQ